MIPLDTLLHQMSDSDLARIEIKPAFEISTHLAELIKNLSSALTGDPVKDAWINTQLKFIAETHQRALTYVCTLQVELKGGA